MIKNKKNRVNHQKFIHRVNHQKKILADKNRLFME